MTAEFDVRQEAERLAAEWLAEIDADLGGYSASVLADRIVTYRARVRREALEEAAKRLESQSNVPPSLEGQYSAGWFAAKADCAKALCARAAEAGDGQVEQP